MTGPPSALAGTTTSRPLACALTRGGPPHPPAPWAFATAPHHHAHPPPPQVLHPDLINENIKKAQYAVRGELYLKGEELRKAGRDILYTNGVSKGGDWGRARAGRRAPSGTSHALLPSL